MQVTYSTIIDAAAKAGDCVRASNLLDQMERVDGLQPSVRPHPIYYSPVLHACMRERLVI